MGSVTLIKIVKIWSIYINTVQWWHWTWKPKPSVQQNTSPKSTGIMSLAYNQLGEKRKKITVAPQLSPTESREGVQISSQRIPDIPLTSHPINPRGQQVFWPEWWHRGESGASSLSTSGIQKSSAKLQKNEVGLKKKIIWKTNMAPQSLMIWVSKDSTHMLWGFSLLPRLPRFPLWRWHWFLPTKGKAPSHPFGKSRVCHWLHWPRKPVNPTLLNPEPPRQIGIP